MCNHTKTRNIHTNIRNFIDLIIQTCCTIITARETELNTAADVRKEQKIKKMTNEQARRFEELIKENEKLKAKNKKLKKKLKKKKPQPKG